MTSVIPSEIVCGHCRQPKRADEMGRQRSSRTGLHSWCKKCFAAWRRERRRHRNNTPEQRRRWDLRTRYGITPQQWDEMFERQLGGCAICTRPMARPCVDHDHTTNAVRGLLCHPCNVKLHALDKWPHRDAAIRYLQRCAT